MKKKKEILESGHSRIPVYKGEKDTIIGMLLVKKLLKYGGENVLVSELELKRMPEVSPQLPLYNLLNIFQTGKSHMEVVVDVETHKPLGIVTLEDLIEELIQEDITDESENPAKKIIKHEESEEDKLHDSDDDKKDIGGGIKLEDQQPVVTTQPKPGVTPYQIKLGTTITPQKKEDQIGGGDVVSLPVDLDEDTESDDDY